MSSEALFRHTNSNLLEDVVFDLAKIANEHFLTAKDFAEKEKNLDSIYPAIIRSVPSFRFLQKLEKYNFNVMDEKLHRKELLLPFYLWKKNRNKEFI